MNMNYNGCASLEYLFYHLLSCGIFLIFLVEFIGIMKEEAESGIETDESQDEQQQRRKRQCTRKSGKNSSGKKKLRSTKS